MDNVLKEELGPLYVGVPGFYEAFFGEVRGLEAVGTAVFRKCKKGDNPLYREKGVWRDWPESAKEKEVLKWFAERVSLFLDLAEEQESAPKTRRRLLAQPNRPLHGSTAERKLDVGFVDDPKASEDSKRHWSQILVPGELKSNPSSDTPSKAWVDLGRYTREVLATQDTRRFVLGFTLCGSVMRLWEFDRVEGFASSPFDINKDGLQFVSAVLGYLWMNDEQLGFDPTILASDGKRYIDIIRNDQTERLVLDEFMKRAPCVAGRATTWVDNPLPKEGSHENLLSRYVEAIWIRIKILEERTLPLVTQSSSKEHPHFNKIERNTPEASAANSSTEPGATCQSLHKQMETAFARLSVVENTLNIKYRYETVSEDCACMIRGCYSSFREKKNLLRHLRDTNDPEHLAAHIILQATTCFQCPRIFLKPYKLVEHE